MRQKPRCLKAGVDAQTSDHTPTDLFHQRQPGTSLRSGDWRAVAISSSTPPQPTPACGSTQYKVGGAPLEPSLLAVGTVVAGTCIRPRLASDRSNIQPRTTR